MALDQQLVDSIINDVLTKWAAEFIAIRQQIADQKLGKATGEGHRSFDHAVIKANGAQLAEALFAFNEYLRFADMKKSWGKQPPVNVLEAWVEKKGVDKFRAKYVTKYGSAPQDVTKLINKIAWGIALSIKKRGQLKRKRVRWYSKSYNKGIGVLYGRMLNELSEESLKNFKKQLTNVGT